MPTSGGTRAEPRAGGVWTSFEHAHDGLVFDIVVDGPGDSAEDGPLVVLLHGFPQRATSWAPVARRLARAGLRTWAMDQRGYSPGARPRTRAAYARHHLVGDVVSLIEASGEPVHLVGHDWGAVVAWHLAARHPRLVRTLTTVSVPHPRAFLRSLLVSDQVLRSWYVAAVQPPVLPELVARAAPGLVERLLRSSGMSEPELEAFRTEIVDAGALSGALGWYRGALPSGRPPGLVRVPTTHVWSDQEQALARAGAELTERHVDADYRLEVLAGTSHWIPTQAPDALADIVLARVRSVD